MVLVHEQLVLAFAAHLLSVDGVAQQLGKAVSLRIIIGNNNNMFTVKLRTTLTMAMSVGRVASMHG